MAKTKRERYEAIAAYQKEHFKKVLLRFQKSYYSDVLLPAAESTGEPMATFIKNAIEQYIHKDGESKPTIVKRKRTEPKPPEPPKINGFI